MHIPIWGIAVSGVFFLAVLTWAALMAKGRNPLPFPDHGSRIFSASSADAKEAIVELLAQQGVHERFQMDSSGILRSIMWDGTIINVSPPEVSRKLGFPSASIGLVSKDPVASAQSSARFLQLSVRRPRRRAGGGVSGHAGS